MITLTRRQARDLRGVFRRNVLGLTSRGVVPPLVLRREGTRLRAQHRYAGLAVEHVLATTGTADEVIVLPLDALADVEGRDDSLVTIEALAVDRTRIRWSDRGIPQTREYEVPLLETLTAFPDQPTAWLECPAKLIDALAEASQTCTDDVTRYALDSIQLRKVDGGHEIIATDGHQLLIQGGFRLPGEEALIARAPIFASRALVRDRPLAVGRTVSHIVIQCGPWTLYLEIRTGVRFPRVHESVPVAAAAATRLRLDDEDAHFLCPALDRLPGADVLNSPVTLDLNGRIAIRARDASGDGVTELVLARSTYAGTPVRLNTSRAFLARAVRLGFTEIEIVDPHSPLVCRDDHRIFAWQPLSAESAIAPADTDTRIESVTCLTTQTVPAQPLKESLAMPKIKPATAPEPFGTSVSDRTESLGLPALIHEAEAILESLTQARARTGRLVVALRRHRKRERLVSATLASLKALKLQDAAG